jgi:hypothetical protein
MFLQKRIVSLGLLFLGACSAPRTETPHLPLDLNSLEYRRYLENTNFELSDEASMAADFPAEQIADVRSAIRLGERSLKWIEHMNSFRDDAHKLRLTSRSGGLRGIPIDAPSRYSPALIQASHRENLAALDDLARSILVDGAPFAQNPALSDEDFVILAKKIDRSYQTAARWQMMAPYLSYYETYSRRDVRGFYDLTRDAQIDAKLDAFENLEPSEKERISANLANLCRNSGQTASQCSGAIDGARANRSLRTLYARLLPAGRQNWDSFFDISNARRDISWNSGDPLSARIPFRRHGEDRLTAFVKDNVEDEFVWNGFRLLFDLKPSDAAGNFPFVTFEPGVTPHVKGLGADHIVMDSNSPLTEWDVQWTIRHEFGHVLGLPDCYVEFYDSAAREMVNYQLDTTDLMCSRAGRMNERIFDELRRAYFR